jgi:uncharacterized protein YerC
LTFANAQIQKYETLQNQALSEAKQKFSDANLKAQDHTNTDAQYMMWFAGLNELACILLIFFVHYYEYRKWHEYQTQQGLNGVKPEKGRFKQGLNGFGGHAPLKDEIEIIDNHYKDTVVGFKPQYKEPDFDANQLEHLSPEKLESKRVERLKNLNDLKAFLKKYAHVVKCVQEGMSNSEVTDACDVSLSTLHNVKRCMRSVQAYTNEEFANI